MTSILIIDDEVEVGNFLSHLFTSKGYKVRVVNSKKEFDAIDFDHHQFQGAMIDLKLPDANGLALLKHVKRRQPHCKVIIMTGYSTIKTAVEAMKLGASDYIEKPFDDIDLLEKQVDDLLVANGTSNEQRILDLATNVGLIVGHNEAMRQVIQTAYKVAGKHVNVLIGGETGTGKEVFARFIHQASQRCYESFIGVNCGALSESLLESELFGHEKGAFTGATQKRKGLFEIASKGTLFLDEIAEASTSIQVKLLRVLETREFMRVGGEQPLHTNARLLAATNEDLQEAVQQKKFREDLFYRLNVVHLEIPPLRDRKEDIPLLIEHFLKRYPSMEVSFSDGALEMLQSYEWPGNIRELSNYITRIVTFADSGHVNITADHLPFAKQRSVTLKKRTANDHTETPGTGMDNFIEKWRDDALSFYSKKEVINLEEVLAQLKQLESQLGKALVLQTLETTHGNRKEAAKRLQISMRKLRYLLNEKRNTE
ncbi:sigma-54 dependent transcriptional regulator [Shouchella clausii]|uniref:Transcriptional regulator n=3 Tax=Shouchella TaxID=2893057 RepID=Q5WLY7_SHOC1|nr:MULTISPECIES: sigma-54 dependent transcriptional regulator [Shouchella]MCM3314739.1 sigma-54 dependent transcriptional regulator [Psychrobacillus sp. MER TA 17]ALA52840.1 Response regulatory protein [Shouchella clausii]MBU3233095.1 sigma-54 dependent transcriptional regulator [Shouchella clausii]MBU3266067.1 sigma-54 dependent transcriptional regulator [Shouchella clausii]MBU3509036.1 sigma-54 dependent transcriptional regulator [Shouchella clausii]